jgi:hypothetical protein
MFWNIQCNYVCTSTQCLKIEVFFKYIVNNTSTPLTMSIIASLVKPGESPNANIITLIYNDGEIVTTIIIYVSSTLRCEFYNALCQ